MEFDNDLCRIPTVYCGAKEQKYPYVENDNRYTRAGTSYECLKKGFGAGMSTELLKHLPDDSLRRIRFVSDQDEKRFRDIGIRNIHELERYSRERSPTELQNLLTRVFKVGKKNLKGFNSVLMYLHRKNIENLPKCVRISFED